MSVIVSVHVCIHVHVTNTAACETIVCNPIDTTVLSKKFTFMEKQGLLINYVYWNSERWVGGLQSTVGGLLQ